MKRASKTPSTPKARAITNASSDDASLTSSGAICTPTANPTAATHSQNSFRPKNKITTPMTRPTIVVEECIGKAGFRQLQCGSVCAKRLFFESPAPDIRIEAEHCSVRCLSGANDWLRTSQCTEDSAHYSGSAIEWVGLEGRACRRGD